MYATIVRSSHQRYSIEKAVLKNFAIFFYYYGILSQTMIIHRAAQEGTGGDHVLFLSATSTSSRKFRHLFATLYVRWLPRIFNRITFNYQNATRWDLPPYRITIWLTDNAMLTSICLLDDLVLGFSDSSLTRQNGGFEFTSVITLYYKQIASHFLSSHSVSNKKEKINISVKFTARHFCGFNPIQRKARYDFGYRRSVASNLIPL